MTPTPRQIPRWRRYARLHGPDPAADVRDELRFHLESKTESLIAQGLSPDQARREAERQFGDLRQVQQLGIRIGETMERRKRLSEHWEDSLQDLRYTLRTLRRDPAFAAISVVILALAIGANTGVFSVVNSLLLRPLPFPQSNELVWIAPPPTGCGLSCATYTADAYEEFRDQSRVYQGITGYMAFSTPDNLRLTGHGDPQPATSIEVVGNFFRVLGVQPSLGRLFSAEETRPGPHPVTLLSNAYWHRQFNADPSIVGKAIEINSTPVTVIGVLPETFDFGAIFHPGSKVDMFTPLDLDAERQWGNILTLTARLKPGITLTQALDDNNRVAPNLYFSPRYPQTLGRYKGRMIPVSLKDYVTGKLRRSLIALWAAVGAILLIAGVNLSNLMLARAASRSREFAIRGALGASRGRVVRQLLLESLILSGCGAVLGLGLAFALVTWLAHQGSIALPLLSLLRLDGQAFGWTIFVAAVTALLFGLRPGLRMASGNLQESLKDSTASAGQGRKHQRVRSALVVTEIALACMLLVSAGLLLRSFMKVLDVDLGFQPDHAAAISVEYDDSAPTGDARALKRSAIFQQVLSRVSAIPGVEAAGVADYLPLGPNREWDTPTPLGKTFAPGELPDPLVYVVTPGFFRAMGIRLSGRDFTWADTPTSQRVVLINASAAKVYWPGEDAVGKILMRDQERDIVIGVVDDVHEETVEGKTGSQIYYPFTQQSPSSAQLVIRSTLPPAAIAADVLHTLRQLNPNQPAAEFKPIRAVVDRAVSPRRFFMILVAAFASLGLLLAALGIYGVISYSVTQKTQEIGVRMALGATAQRVQRGVLTDTFRLAVIGLLLGSIASFAANRLLSNLLFATSPWDPLAYAGTLLTLVAVALLAGYLPARRASRISPMVALRNS
jgi:predicted permease